MKLYFAGFGSKEAQTQLVEKECNKLLAFEIDKSWIAKWFEFKKNNPNLNIFIDSGAFTAHTKGREVDVDAYIKFLNENDEFINCFAQVDRIPGKFREPKTREQLENAPKESWDNYLYMIDKVKSPKKLIPIFHQGEDFKWLHNLLNYTDENNEHIDYIGISPANDRTTKQKIEWLHIVFDIIKNSNHPNVKTHGFGVTSKEVIEQFPFFSVDSTSWFRGAINGTLETKLGDVSVSSKKVKGNIKYNYDTADANTRIVIETEIKRLGYELQELKDDYKKE